MNPLALTLALTACQAPVVLDGAKLFDREATAEATAEVRKIKEEPRFRGIDLVVETTRKRPDAQRVWWNKRRTRNAELDRFARERAEELRYERQQTGGTFGGVYVVVVEGENVANREVGVAAYPENWGAEDEVSRAKREGLRAVLLTPEARADKGRGLRELVVRFRAQQEGIARPDGSALSTYGALLVVGTLMGVWLLVRFVRWRVVAAAKAEGSPAMALYQPAVMGTLFGLPAAFWVHDELFRVLPPAVPPPTAGKPDSLSLPKMPTLASSVAPAPPPPASTEPFTLPDPDGPPAGSP